MVLRCRSWDKLREIPRVRSPVPFLRDPVEMLTGSFKKRLLRGRTDEELMALWVESRRAGRGEQAAFEVLWERNAQATRAVVGRVLGRHRSLADEVFQDAWLEVARAERYRPGSFRGYIRTVAARKAVDRIARSSVRHGGGEEDRPDLVATGSGPADLTRAREGAALVLGIVGRLPDAQRIAWTLKYAEELTYEEIADAMGTPVGTAKTRVRLATASLADALSAAGVARADLEEG
jgi:RNA polymerase sigma-70 factor, ECF subfamily